MPQDTPRHSVSVAAVIVDDQQRMLAIRRRDNDHWEPPGGVLELDEDIHQGLRREVLEETGLAVEPGPLTGVYKNMVRGIVALVFRCQAPPGTPRSTPEVTDLRWMTSKEVANAMDEAYAIRMLDALGDPPASVRRHDGRRLNSPPS